MIEVKPRVPYLMKGFRALFSSDGRGIQLGVSMSTEDEERCYAQAVKVASREGERRTTEQAFVHTRNGKLVEQAVAERLSAAGFKVERNNETESKEYYWDVAFWLPSFFDPSERLLIEAKEMNDADKTVVFSRPILHEQPFLQWDKLALVVIGKVESRDHARPARLRGPVTDYVRVWALMAPELFWSKHRDDVWALNQKQVSTPKGSHCKLDELEPFYQPAFELYA